MNCSSLKLERTAIDHHGQRASHDETEKLLRIRRILDAHPIDLGDLVKAINAVPEFALRLCRMMYESGVECSNVGDAAVLAGRAGIRSLLDERSQSQTPLKQQKLEWATRNISLGLVKL